MLARIYTITNRVNRTPIIGLRTWAKRFGMHGQTLERRALRHPGVPNEKGYSIYKHEDYVREVTVA